MREYHVTPLQLNFEWTEELLALTLKKREQHFRRLNEAIEAQRAGIEGAGKSDLKPRRVPPEVLMAKIRRCEQMRNGPVPHPQEPGIIYV